ncbi:MAG: hypothetical protein LBT46_10120 [Planctomycetaceae bacterium]|jgi:hypothetical protein|nr:hypothetical protein [Planctomycetaceae bacterium]
MPTITPKQWVDNWKRVGPILEQIEAEELRALDAQEAIQRIISLCDWCCERAEPTKTSGLVEQQWIFAKAGKTKL